MTDNRDFDERLARMAREAVEVPDAPKAEMWEAIDGARRARRGVVPMKRGRVWYIEAVAVAAVLVLGVLLGRVTSNRPGDDATPVAAATEETGIGDVFTIAARDHLRDSEQFLVEFRTGVLSGEAHFASSDAYDLLATTRLLLDSPASDDVAMQELLLDLELVLAQIASMDDIHNPDEEEDLINEGLEESDVLPRLRLLLPQPLNEAEGAL